MTESKLDGALEQFIKNLPEVMPGLQGRRLLVVGDIGLDEYVNGDVRRISPEAPVPVVEVRSQDVRLGLAANVAQNVASLGGIAEMIAVVGADESAERLRQMLRAADVETAHLVVDSSRPTTRKLRVMTEHHHIVRVDFEHKLYLSDAMEKTLLDKVSSRLSAVDGVVIEDYAKGVFSENTLQQIIQMAKKAGKKVLVDPNRSTPTRYYRGADLMTPNRDEAVALSGLDFDELRTHPDFLFEVGEALLHRAELQHLVLTRGKEGMSLFSAGQVATMPTVARQVFDVTGAGDTVIAAIGLGWVSGLSLQDACLLGNLAAGVVVGKVGCVPCTQKELLDFSVQLMSKRVKSPGL